MNRLAKHPHILHEAIIDISKGYNKTLDISCSGIYDTQKLFVTLLTCLGKHSANAQSLAGLWDYVKDKLGYKSPKKSVPVEDDPLPVHRQPRPSAQQETPLHEIWKPGYRGRTDNQRF